MKKREIQLLILALQKTAIEEARVHGAPPLGISTAGVTAASAAMALKLLLNLMHDAAIALHPFTLVDEFPEDVEEQAYIIVCIQDSGCGMLRANGERIGTDIMLARKVVAAIEEITK